MGAVQPIGDDNAENRIAEELKAFVGRQTPRFVRKRPVREGKNKQLGVDADSEPLHKGIS
jgi:hypothetical protein